MALNLYTISDELYALSDLKSDHLFKKIPPGKIRYYIDSSIQIGVQDALKIKHSSESIDIKKLCDKNNIKVNIIEKEYRVGQIKFRAEIFFKKRHINIIKSSIEQLHSLLDEKVGYDDIINIHIAHEYYHFIEHDNKVKTNGLLERVRLFSFGPFARCSTIVKTSEIAAHMFCRELLDLDFHPKALDYDFMLKQNMITESELEIYFGQLRDIISSASRYAEIRAWNCAD